MTTTLSTTAPVVDLTTSALLVSLNISTWTARRTDRAAAADLHARHGAKRGAGNYAKHLLGEAPELAAVVTAAGAARTAHYAATLPWSDEGWRLLPTANYLDYTSRMSDLHVAFENAVRALVSAYPQLRDAARDTLGTLYRASDYPSADDIASRYSWSTHYRPIPSSGDIRVDLGAPALTAIRESVTARANAAIQDAARDAWARLHAAVSHVRERLSDPDNIFRDTLVTSTRDLCDVLSRLNILNDPALDDARRAVESLVSVQPDTLRNDVNSRAAAAAQADAILRNMRGYYQP